MSTRYATMVLTACLALVSAACSGGSSKSSEKNTPEDTSPAVEDVGAAGEDVPGSGPDIGASDAVAPAPVPVSGPKAYLPPRGQEGDACGAGNHACGDTPYCCPSGSVCVDNPDDQLDCGGTSVCCASCVGDIACGGGCCAAGTSCVASSGGADDCGAAFCCSPEPDAPCPADVASTCPEGTTCLWNRSARSCAPSSFACYHPSGLVACPGEIGCGTGVDFCPSGTECASLQDGVCPQQSRGAGNVCCKPAETPDTICCCTFGEDLFWHCIHAQSDDPNALCFTPWPECCDVEWTLCE